ncbi:hypothetical protein IAT38_003065 [Cryptococcus sp. DSM 104549]
MPFAHIDPSLMASPPGSPRSSVSSSTNACGALLTPLYELDKAAGEMAISDPDTGGMGEGEEANDLAGFAAAIPKPIIKTRGNLSLAVPPPPAFDTLAFAPSPTPASSSLPPSHTTPISPDITALPAEGFSFGTCPSVPFLGTPVAEQGPFEYPDLTGSSASPRGSMSSDSHSPRDHSFAHSMAAHRRLSTMSQHSHHSHHSIHSTHSHPSPPATRRSSTCSTITTLPIAGRRPSIVHSTTLETTVPFVERPVSPVAPPLAAQPAPSHTVKRPSTLMFQQKALPAPIPPSLLARRGSLPAAQLFGLPLLEQQHRSRSNGPVVTTTALYQRRQSVVSDATEESTGSAAGVAGGLAKARSTRISASMSAASAESTAAGYNYAANTARRGSLPFIPQPSVAAPPTRSSVPSRSSSITSSSRTSFSSRRPTSTAFRSAIPANFAFPSPSPSQRRAPLPASVPCSPSPRSRSSERHHSRSSSGDESVDEDLPTPSLTTVVPPDMSVSVNPPASVVYWEGASGQVVESPVVGMGESDHLGRCPPTTVAKGPTPLETPLLATVFERPPLESADSGVSEKTL